MSYDLLSSVNHVRPVIRITFNREWQEFKYYDEKGSSGFTSCALDAWVSANAWARQCGGVVKVSSSAVSRVNKARKEDADARLSASLGL